MHLFMLIITGGLLAVALRLLVVDGFTGWIASLVILRPWQHNTQVRIVKALYAFVYSACLIVWGYTMIYLYLLD